VDRDEAGRWAGLLVHVATASPAALAAVRGWMAQHRQAGDAPVPGAADLAATLAAVHDTLAPGCPCR
jgi:hypothetical protein